MPIGVIVYLTQDSPERRAYLQNSLYFLFRNLNGHHRYPVRIFHEPEYSHTAQQTILDGVRGPLRDLVRFVPLAPGDFIPPAEIDLGAVERSIGALPKSRTLSYRLMCRWWLQHSYRYVADYEYMLRLDDDTILEEPPGYDPFRIMHEHDLDFASAHVHVDNPLFTHGLKATLEALLPNHRSVLDRLFVPARVESARIDVDRVSAFFRGAPCDLPAWTDDPVRASPIIYYNNFSISRTGFWQRSDVQRSLAGLDEHGGVFYCRWGDAPVQTLLTAALAGPDRTARIPIRYSKRTEREIDPYYNAGIYHAWDLLDRSAGERPTHTVVPDGLPPYQRTGSLTDFPAFQDHLRRSGAHQYFTPVTAAPGDSRRRPPLTLAAG